MIYVFNQINYLSYANSHKNRKINKSTRQIKKPTGLSYCSSLYHFLKPEDINRKKPGPRPN